MNRRAFLQSLSVLGLLPSLPQVFSHQHRMTIPSNTEGLLQALVETALRQGASYADARLVLFQSESLQIQKDQLYRAMFGEEAGIALRVFKDQNWGFSATNDLKNPDHSKMARQACNLASALSRVQILPFSNEGRLKSAVRSWKSPCKQDPFEVPLKEKLDFLKDLATAPLNRQSIAFSVANLFATKRTVQFFSSLNASVEQTHITTYPNFGVTAFDQNKGLVDSRGSSLEPMAVGYEITEEFPFKEQMERSVEEVLEYQKAESVRTGEYDLVLAPSHLWHVVYETMAAHLDSYAIHGIDGTNPQHQLFTPSDFGKKVFDAPLLTMLFDNSVDRALASYGWDDAGRTPVKGKFLDKGTVLPALSADEMADIKDAGSSCTRASNWRAVPRYSMPNILLQPDERETTLDDLVAGTEKGLLLAGRGGVLVSTNRKWFRANSQVAWFVENGKRKHMVRDFDYDTSLLYFWNVLSGIGGSNSIMMGGDLFPQNNNPLWELPFSVIVPAARFSRVNIISNKS